MKVLKFGGTSVGSAENILKVCEIVKSNNAGFVVTVSAMGGVTNQLEELGAKSLNNDFQSLFYILKEKHFKTANHLLGQLSMDQNMHLEKQFENLHKICSGVAMLKELSERTRAMILSHGELLSSYLLTETLKKDNNSVSLLNPTELIITDNNYLNAVVDFKTTNQNIQKAISMNGNYVTPGFIASSFDGEITTLGRGGSDYTAAIFAGALQASVLEIWSDVDGMMSANPKLVRRADTIEQLSYDEALELSHFGAKVLYPFAVNPILEMGIPLYLKNTFNPKHPGTLVTNKIKESDRPADIAGISSMKNVALITMSGADSSDYVGYTARIFNTLERGQIDVVFVTQSGSENSVCFGVNQNDCKKALKSLKKEFELELMKGTVNDLIVDEHLSVVAVVGDNMRFQPGVSGNTFSVLGENGVNIRAIAQGASERNISIVVDEENERKAINVLHEKFFSRAPKTVHLFVIGTGNVGKKFLDILFKQKDELLEKYNLTIRLSGITNSRYMRIVPEGMSEDEVDSLVDQNIGDPADIEGFIDQMIVLNRRNSVLIDNTANELICNFYEKALEKSISVVACNKISLSTQYSTFKDLRSHAEKRNVEFRFETTVGASLPVINTIEDLISSGDRVTSIDAVLSGSLNFIFNNFSSSNTFKEIVLQARDEGYTEPDPRIDLSGIDVMRKVLILARVSGYGLEEEMINREALFDENELNGADLDAFYNWLENNEGQYQKMLEEATSKNCKLKYVASFDGKSGKTGLKMIAEGHPFYNLEGKDNIVMIHTARYKDEPLVIKGAGAGAELTAAGVFSDILRIVNR